MTELDRQIFAIGNALMHGVDLVNTGEGYYRFYQTCNTENSDAVRENLYDVAYALNRIIPNRGFNFSEYRIASKTCNTLLIWCVDIPSEYVAEVKTLAVKGMRTYAESRIKALIAE